MSSVLTIMQLASSIFGSIGVLASNPVLKDTGAGQIVPLVGLAMSLLTIGEAGREKLVELDNRLKEIVASGAPPRDEDWKHWDERHQAAKERIQNA